MSTSHDAPEPDEAPRIDEIDQPIEHEQVGEETDPPS